MIDYKTLCESFERQINMMRDELNRKEYENLIKSAELLSTYLEAKLGEIEKESENGNL
jgi:hypothetical protein